MKVAPMSQWLSKFYFQCRSKYMYYQLSKSTIRRFKLLLNFYKYYYKIIVATYAPLQWQFWYNRSHCITNITFLVMTMTLQWCTLLRSSWLSKLRAQYYIYVTFLSSKFQFCCSVTYNPVWIFYSNWYFIFHFNIIKYILIILYILHN